MSFLAGWKEPWKTEFSNSLRNSFVSIFRGDFLGQKEGSYFDTCTQYTANHALFIEL